MTRRPSPGAHVRVILLLLGAAPGSVADAEDDLLRDLPAGIYLRTQIDVTPAHRDEIGRKLGVSLSALTNSVLQVHGRTLQVNIMTAADDAGATALYQALLKVKP